MKSSKVCLEGVLYDEISTVQTSRREWSDARCQARLVSMGEKAAAYRFIVDDLPAPPLALGADRRAGSGGRWLISGQRCR